ncbi:hypothetical protein QBC43DRAFT_353381 [Cladorrhinum sp. PSN259]|nr:hypothetical protein QBC43DRAFT_353381 [Cladorrhinum sp. PSN259]
MDVRDAAQRPLYLSLDFYNSLCLPPHEKTVLEAVLSIAKSIFERRYFFRVWILQEVSLAKAALVICGGYQISWKYFQALPGMTSRLLLKDLSFPDAVTLGTRKFHGQFDLLHLLDIAINSQATDPRDNVFGVFDMMSLPSRSLGFIANYNSIVEDAYRDIEVALNILDVLNGTEGNGILKLIVRAMGPRSHPRLPAWVPDWSRPVNPNIAQALQKPSIDLPKWLPHLQVYIALRGDHEHRELLDLVVDKSRREISFNGARVCSLQELVEAAFFFDVWIPGHDSFRVFSSHDLDTLVVTLEGCSLLTCYTLVCPDDCSLPFRNRMFLLSSNDEFPFLGLCFIINTDKVQLTTALSLPPLFLR